MIESKSKKKKQNITEQKIPRGKNENNYSTKLSESAPEESAPESNQDFLIFVKHKNTSSCKDIMSADTIKLLK